MTTSAGFELTGQATPVRQLLREVWASRSLIAILAKKDFFVRYRRAYFGMLWAVILPVFQASVLALVFSRIVRVKTEVPYVAFVFPAYAAWSYFAGTFSTASSAIVDNAGLSNKIYFPRAVLPLTPVVSALYGFWFTLLANGAITIAIAGFPGWRLLLLVPALVLLVSLTASFGLFVSSVHVYFRDVRYMIGAVMSVWMFVTPILYPLSRAPDSIQPLIRANPMTGVCQLFRAAYVAEEPRWGPSVLVSVVWVIVAAVAAALMHRRYNRVFSDLL